MKGADSLLLRKILGRALSLCLSVMLLTACFTASAAEVTLQIEYVPITSYGFVADTFNGVEAKYNPWGKNYDCGELLRRYYKELYGLDIALYGNRPHVVNNEDYDFVLVTEPQAGDAMFASAWARRRSTCHWAIAKVVDVEGNTITVFEQNWRGGGKAGVGRQIPYENNCYDFYRLTYKGGEALTLQQRVAQNDAMERENLARIAEEERILAVQEARQQVVALCQEYRQKALSVANA